MMKNNSKSVTELRVVPHAVRQMHNGEAAVAGEAAVVLNMREREESLQVVGTPAVVGSIPAGSRLLLVHNASCGKMMLAVDDGFVVTCNGKAVLTLDSEPIGACEVGDYAVVATKGRLWVLLAADGAYAVLDSQEAVPEISLCEADETNVTVDMASVDFAEPYDSWPSLLTVADRETLLSRLRRGVAAATDAVTAKGRYAGAVLARYGVRLFDDSYLFLSAPVMLGSSTLATVSATVDVAVSGGKFAGVPAASLAMPSYALGITVHQGIPASWHGIVKAVDVLVTDAVGIASSGSSLICHSATSTTGTRRNVLEIGLAAPSAPSVASSLLGGKWHVVATTCHIDALDGGDFVAANVGRSASVLFPSAVTHALLAPMPCGIDVDTAQAAAVHERISRLIVPSAVTGHGGRAMVGVAAWKCVNRWGLGQVCRAGAAEGGCAWTVTATLATSHGESTVVASGHLPFVPRSVSPMLPYPDARATHVRIQVEADADGAVTAWESDLWAVPSASMAVAYGSGFAANALVPVSAATSVQAVNDSDPALGSMAVMAMGNPFVAEAVCPVGADTVRAIALACRPIYSSGFGRYPVYVFTGSALYAVPRLTTGAYGEARLLYRDGIEEGGPVVGGDESVWFVSATDGSLCRVEGAKCTRVLRGLGSGASLAWNGAESELVALGADGVVSVVSAITCRSWKRSLTAASLYGSGSCALAVTSGGEVLDFGLENQVAAVPVCYRSHPVELNRGFPCRPVLALWRLVSQQASVRLAVNGERGASCHGFVVGGVSVSGNLDAPIAMRLLSSPVRTVRLALSGSLPSGAMLLPVTLRESHKKQSLG